MLRGVRRTSPSSPGQLVACPRAPVAPPLTAVAALPSLKARRSTYMLRRISLLLVLVALSSSLVVPAARAFGFGDPAAAGFAPRVPISAFARTASWFDPSRLHLTSTFSVGSGFGGGTNALSVTRLSYQFGAPVSMSVSLGNTFGFD